MECIGWEERMSALVDAELEDAEAQALFNHLSVCENCRDFYRRLIALQQELRDPWAAQAAPAASRGMWRKAPGGTPRTHTQPSLIQLSRGLVLAAAVFLVLLAGLTSALVFERATRQAQIIYVVGLPTIEVEATYLPTDNRKL